MLIIAGSSLRFDDVLCGDYTILSSRRSKSRRQLDGGGEGKESGIFKFCSLLVFFMKDF